MEHQVELFRKPNLTKGQQELYSLLCEKVKSGEKVLFDEAKKIWLDTICKNVRNGTPYYFEYYQDYDKEKQQWIGGYRDMPDTMVASYAISWLLRNIGILVVKGYLKVIPQLELYVKA